jgi:hypothetical protein
MRLGHRLLLLSAFSLQLLAGCGSTSVGTESGTIAPPVASTGSSTTTTQPPGKAGPGSTTVAGTDDEAMASSSVGAVFSVAVGASQAVSVTFTSSDGLAMTGFAVSGMDPMPAGWSGPDSFSCAAVGPGSGCVLVLTYAPLATDSGTLTLNCVYVDNAGLARTPGPCLTLTYRAIAPNNVVANVSPIGEIDAIIGASKQAVSVSFATDDGNAATDFSMNLGALPSGWSSSATALSCALVSTGNGCHLPLVFAPAAGASGTLALTYSYIDSSGAARSGSINIPYASTADDTLVASAAPSGQINTALMATQSVSVTFTTNDGQVATGVQLTSQLAALPAGWTSEATSFSCDSANSGNGCQLHLTYAPTALGSGTLSLRYSYVDASGMLNSGVVDLPYAATTNDNVVATVSPSGQIVSTLGAGAQAVTLTFTTDDARLATAFGVTSSLAALPAGWSSASSAYTCQSLASGSSCQLTLRYAPTALDEGTLSLNYAYLNNAGESKSGSVQIPYRTTTNDNVIAAPNPLSLTVLTGSTNPVMVAFSTDDGQPGSSLAVNLSSLPAGWSGSSSFVCATVSAGTSCQLPLTFAPNAAANGTLAFGFNYTNDAGIQKTGSVSIPYVATAPPPGP